MRIEWHGQSAFTLEGGGESVFIDPFGDMSSLEERGIKWEYPAIEVNAPDLLLVTHEHRDHNAVEVIPGGPELVRSLAGSHETGIGKVVGIASEHDAAAGTERGSNTIYRFDLDGVRIAHFGDFGQAELRPEQRAALGAVDLVLVPAGGGPTMGGKQVAELALSLDPSLIVPMHYRTPRIGFLETEEEFAAAFPTVVRPEGSSFETADVDRPEGGAVAVIPAAP